MDQGTSPPSVYFTFYRIRLGEPSNGLALMDTVECRGAKSRLIYKGTHLFAPVILE